MHHDLRWYVAAAIVLLALPTLLVAVSISAVIMLLAGALAIAAAGVLWLFSPPASDIEP